jgi:hypothetical protein
MVLLSARGPEQQNVTESRRGSHVYRSRCFIANACHLHTPIFKDPSCLCCYTLVLFHVCTLSQNLVTEDLTIQ